MTNFVTELASLRLENERLKERLEVLETRLQVINDRTILGYPRCNILMSRDGLMIIRGYSQKHKKFIAVGIDAIINQNVIL